GRGVYLLLPPPTRRAGVWRVFSGGKAHCPCLAWGGHPAPADGCPRRLAVGTHHGCRRPNTRVSGTGPSVEVPVGKIVAAEYVSVDGVMQDPGGVGEIEVGGWTGPYWNDEL